MGRQGGGTSPVRRVGGRIEDWGEPFCEFLSTVEEQRHNIPGLRNILWIAHHGPTLPLAQACWARQPQIVEWSHTIALNALDPESLSRWLDLRLPNWEPSEEFLYLLEEESSGNPALLERILISFIEDGRLKRTWEGWEHEDVASDTITPLVQRTADSYRDLPQEQRVCLDALVVLGGSGDPTWLAQVLGSDEKELSRTLRKLRRAGWIDQELNGARHCFHTSYQQKAVRIAIAEDDWVQGNARVAEWLSDSESAASVSMLNAWPLTSCTRVNRNARCRTGATPSRTRSSRGVCSSESGGWSDC